MEKNELIEGIKALRKQKNAVILAHYYTIGDIQDLADYVGDSLGLAQQAAKSDADIIVMCGVHFMGETCKILCPEKKVLVPDLAAGCSLADSCPAEEFGEFVKAHPDYTVLSYVNTTAAVKYYTDIVVTSGNALKIVNSLPKDEKIIFAPDRNLGSYIMKLKAEHPNAQVLVHPECKRPVVLLADKVGSTAVLLKYSVESDEQEFIVATESGILHEMQKQAPEKTFIPVPPEVSEGSVGCSCNECAYMRLNTLQKLYDCLLNETPEIHVDENIIERAKLPIDRMLELSK